MCSFWRIWSFLADPSKNLSNFDQIWSKLGTGMARLILTKIWSKFDEMLRNVVFGGPLAKMAQKQHIGNFQI